MLGISLLVFLIVLMILFVLTSLLIFRMQKDKTVDFSKMDDNQSILNKIQHMEKPPR